MFADFFILEDSLSSFNESLHSVNSVTAGTKAAFALHKSITSHNVAYCHKSEYTTFQIME